MGVNKVLLDSDLSKSVGEWVVICKNEVVTQNKDIIKLKQKINKCKSTPTIAKIPKKRNSNILKWLSLSRYCRKI